LSAIAPSEAALWNAEQFVEALRSQGMRYHSLHPFHVRMNTGQLSREEMRRWAANRFYYQENIPIKDAAILSNCPDLAVRRLWIQRIIDHDGRGEGEGGIEAWLRLGEAAGLKRDEMLDRRHLLPGVRFAVDAYVNFCRTRPWVEAVASSLTELFSPDAIRERIAALERHYTWIDSAGFEYFRRRLDQAPRDVDHALAIVTRHCVTRREQEKAVDALRFKCDLLWSIMDAIERGDSRPGSAA